MANSGLHSGPHGPRVKDQANSSPSHPFMWQVLIQCIYPFLQGSQPAKGDPLASLKAEAGMDSCKTLQHGVLQEELGRLTVGDDI